MAAAYLPADQSQSNIPLEIIRFAIDAGMMITQINSQRYFGPSMYLSPCWTPAHGSEVFIGRLPRFWNELKLAPLIFMHCGPFYQLRMIVDFSGTNKGYAFVKFYHPDQAQYAIQMLNGFQINPKRNQYIAAGLSVDNCRLVLGGLPTYKTVEQLREELSSFFDDGISDVWWDWQDFTARCRPKGFVVVAFESHSKAAQARSKIFREIYRPWGFEITVDWAEPVGVNPNDPASHPPHLLRVRNLAAQTTPKMILRLFNEASGYGLTHFKKFKCSAILLFRTRRQAEEARLNLHNTTVDGNKITVIWSDPNRCKYMETMRRVIPGVASRDEEGNNGMIVREEQAPPPLPNIVVEPPQQHGGGDQSIMERFLASVEEVTSRHLT